MTIETRAPEQFATVRVCDPDLSVGEISLMRQIPRKQPTDRWKGKARIAGIVSAYALLAVLLMMPMLIVTVPLGADNLNHLARIHVLANMASDSDLARLFRVKGDVVPYLGMDLLLTPFATFVPTILVGRVYIVALVWGLVGAVAVLRRQFTSQIGITPIATGLVAYNGLLAWGFLNYILGLIFALLAFALWDHQRSQSWVGRAALFSVVATGLYFLHLLSFVLYGILVASYEVLGRHHPWQTPVRDWLLLVGQAIPALFLWSTLAHGSPGEGHMVRYAMAAKALALESPFLFRGAAGGFDAGILVFILAGMALIFGLRRGWLEWPRTIAYPALTLLGLAIFLPFRVFGVALLDLRLPLAATCLAFAGLSLAPSRRRYALPLAAVVVLVTVVRTADVSLLMYRCDSQYAELRRALAGLPRGTELTTVEERTEPAPGAACTSLPIYEHIAQLVTVDRSGYAPDFFAHVTFVDVLGGRLSDTDPVSAETFNAAPQSGYVLWIHLGRRRAIPPGLRIVYRGSFFDIWAVSEATEDRVRPAPPD